MNIVDDLLKEYPYWIRFELGLSELIQDDFLEDYFKESRNRAECLFHALIDKEDTLLLVNRIIHHIDYKGNHLPKMNRFLRNKIGLKNLKYEILPDETDENENLIHQYSIETKAMDFKTSYFIEASANKQFWRKPAIIGNFYIVNISKNLIFHMYDDRGLDVFSLKKESLYPLYQTFRSWILNYNRIEIDTIFEDGLHFIKETPEEKELRLKQNEEKVLETGINLYKTNTCHIVHTLEIPSDLINDCMKEMSQIGFTISNESNFIKATKTEALALIDYQSELMNLYAKKYNGKYQGWNAKRAF